MDGILHHLMVVLAGALSLALTNWAVAQARRNGVEVDATTQDMIRKNAEDAVLLVEEKGADLAARGLKKLTSGEKLQLAKDILTGKHPDLGPADSDHAIHAALPRTQTAGALYDPTKSGQG